MRYAATMMVVAALGCGAEEGDVERTAQGIANGQVITVGPIARSTVMFTPGNGDGTHGCTATLLDEAHALTAAHCLLGAAPATEPVLVFSPAFSPTAPRRSVTALVPADPRSSVRADIAVLTFAGGLPAGYTPVGIAAAGFPLRVGDDVTHAGYGQTTRTVNDRGQLRAASTKLDAVRNGRIYLRGVGSVCSGDSGGPDFVVRRGRLVQVGVHVSGDCAESASSTDVRAFEEFLRSAGGRPSFVRGE